MPNPIPTAILAALSGATLAMAQPPAPATAPDVAATAGTGALAWPRDAARVIARVDGRELTLGDLVDHVKARHDPFFDKLLGTPEGARAMADDRYGADWVREFADVVMLQGIAKQRGITEADSNAALSAALKASFQRYLAKLNLPAEPDQDLIDVHLARFQRYYGLRTEVKGWLDALVPDTATEAELREYFSGHPWQFGGVVNFAHILVRHRDPHTLRLLDQASRQRAWQKMADIRSRLEKDGSNFEELAARFSEDRKTAAKGGILRNVSRFQPGLPAILCRTAWELRDGQVSEPIESAYGLHLVKRISTNRTRLVLFTDGAKPLVRRMRRESLQEKLLFDGRREHGVALLY